MPTYTCWSVTGQIPPSAREQLVTAVANVHREVALAPRYLVQVLFAEVEEGAHFIAGRPAPTGQVWIRGDIRAGRTAEQKQELLIRLTAEVADILALSPELVWVYLCEIPGTNMTEYGYPLRPPGEEEAWLADLPQEVQARLRGLR